MARITKIELQQINTRLATENEALRAELSRLRNDAATQRAEHSAPRAQSLAQFCSAYCATHNVRSVPGHVVQAWRNAQ